MVKVFYGDRVLLFSAPEDTVPEGFRAIEGGESFAKMLENLEKYKRLRVVSDDPRSGYETFLKNFRAVDAAGGVVENPEGQLLMIFRNGRWDLPKGHREEGEEFRACALRETWEETGVEPVLKGKEPVHTTFHFYSNNGVWEMKRTVWYGMCASRGSLIPQTAEGIACVEWVARGNIPAKAATCFPSVREVLRAAGWM